MSNKARKRPRDNISSTGDVSKQNEMFKMLWYDMKLKWIERKDELHLPQVLGPTYIVPLTNRIFHPAYDTLRENLKAITDQGWFPCKQEIR